MSRIKACFEKLHANKRRALIPFITAGDPNPDVTVALMHALVKGGADLIELGVPFSDPMADGPVIQRASERALKHGVTLHNVIDMVTEFRRDNPDTPVILMGYLNPVEVMGYQAFAESCQQAGVDGALIVDMPPEEAGEFSGLLRGHDMDQVFLLAPTTSDVRLDRVCSTASGFIYYVSLKGVTGSDRLDLDDVAAHIEHIRAHTELPVGVGFGIKDADTAGRVAGFSDAVVIGSALVERIAGCSNDSGRMTAEATAFMQSMRTAMDAA